MTELFLKIVNMSIAAGWLVLAVALVRLLLKKAPKWVNPLLWGIVGLRLVLPDSIESVLSLVPSAEPISPEILYAPEPVIRSGFPIVNELINPVLTENLAPEAGVSASPMETLVTVGACIWIAGVLGMLIYTAVSYRKLRRRIVTSVLLKENIYQSEQVETPFVLGIVHPRIYLPFGLKESSRAYVIAHEKAHIHRYDNRTKPFGFLLLSVYWFHPLIWLGYVLFCRDIELACDERVIKEMNHEERADYSQALLNCSVPGRQLLATPLTFSEVDVKERVKRVLTYKKPAFLLTVTAVGVCALVAVCFLTNPKTISATGEDSVSVSSVGGADGPEEMYTLSEYDKMMQELPEGKDDAFYRKWGEIQADYYREHAAERTNLLLEYESQREMMTDYFRLLGEDAPKEKAQDFVMRDYALYFEAVGNGYAVSDWDTVMYLDSLKETMNSASNAENVRVVAEAFPSEDDYWNYLMIPYKKRISVRNYLKDKAETFAKEKGMETTSSEFADLWVKERERLTLEAVGKYFTAEGAMNAEAMIPLKEEEVLEAAKQAGLQAVLSESETRFTIPGQVSYTLRSPDETYGSTENAVFAAAVSYANTASGRYVSGEFISDPSDETEDFPFTWEYWKKQMAFAALVYGGFADADEIYDTFSAMEIPAYEGSFEMGAELSGAHCILTCRERTSTVGGENAARKKGYLVSVQLFESEAFYEEMQKTRKMAAEPFAVELTSCEIVEAEKGGKELSLGLAIENTTDKDLKDVWMEVQFNKEAGAFIADHFVNNYHSEKTPVISGKEAENDGEEKVCGMSHEWRIPLTTEEALKKNYDSLSMEDINSAFQQITVTVHMYGRTQVNVLPLELSDSAGK